MDLRWLPYFACTHVIGHPKDTKMQCNQVIGSPDEEDVQGIVKSSKYANEEGTCKDKCPTGFQMPLHYPRYKKADYEKMEEWKVDRLMREYGLNFKGTLDEKRAFAMGAFLWPDQV